MSAPLYNERILRLTTEVPEHRIAVPMASSEKRSPICGSRVTIEIDLGADGRVSDVGILVRACALGQASSALLAANVVGRSPQELAAARDALTQWLAGSGPLPDWPGIDVFTPALTHSARHPSIRLAFEAAAEAADHARGAD